jgi:hypothetical protein
VGGLIGERAQLAVQLHAAHCDMPGKFVRAKFQIGEILFDNLYHFLQELLIHRGDGNSFGLQGDFLRRFFKSFFAIDGFMVILFS